MYINIDTKILSKPSYQIFLEDEKLKSIHSYNKYQSQAFRSRKIKMINLLQLTFLFHIRYFSNRIVKIDETNSFFYTFTDDFDKHIVLCKQICEIETADC